jgi:hypothetical protein
MAAKQTVSVEAAYEAKATEARAQLAKLSALLEAHKEAEIHWGHVGDLEHLTGDLAELIDWLTPER